MTVIEKVLLAVAPAASVTLTLMLLKVPLAVGVPLRVMVLPLRIALKPDGKPVAVKLLNAPVPSVMPMVPL